METLVRICIIQLKYVCIVLSDMQVGAISVKEVKKDKKGTKFGLAAVTGVISGATRAVISHLLKLFTE